MHKEYMYILIIIIIISKFVSQLLVNLSSAKGNPALCNKNKLIERRFISSTTCKRQFGNTEIYRLAVVNWFTLDQIYTSLFVLIISKDSNLFFLTHLVGSEETNVEQLGNCLSTTIITAESGFESRPSNLKAERPASYPLYHDRPLI